MCVCGRSGHRDPVKLAAYIVLSFVCFLAHMQRPTRATPLRKRIAAKEIRSREYRKRALFTYPTPSTAPFAQTGHPVFASVREIISRWSVPVRSLRAPRLLSTITGDGNERVSLLPSAYRALREYCRPEYTVIRKLIYLMYYCVFVTGGWTREVSGR